MEFLQTIKNTIHGWSEETRKFLAMATMGIGLLAFFSLWISSVSSRLVAIGPVAPAAPAPTAEALPTAFPPFADQNIAQFPSAPNPPLPVAEHAPTPIQGVAETFGGIRQLFRTTDQPSDTIGGKLNRAGARLVGIVFDLLSWAQNFLAQFGGWLYQRASTLIAS